MENTFEIEQNVSGKRLPNSKEAESYVLGSILIEEQLANEFCGALVESDFFDKRNKAVFKAIKSINDRRQEVNTLAVIEELKIQGTYDLIGEEYLYELVNSVPTVVSLNIEGYINIIKDKSLQRELYNATESINKKILAGEDTIDDLIAMSEKTVKDIANKQKVGMMKPVSFALDKVFKVINDNAQKEGNLIGIDTGYDSLNEMTLGFQPGQLIILAARPGVGKSAFALNMCLRMCTNFNARVAYYSLEMSYEQLVMRLLSISTTVPLKNILRGNLVGNESSRLFGGRLSLDSKHLYIDETLTNSLEDIKLQCRKLKRENNLDFIVIDYLQLLTLTNNSKKQLTRYEEVTQISRQLKLLAMELQVPVLALSQLSRAPETRNQKEGKQPILSDLRESGSIEQDADIVIFLHAEKKPGEKLSSYIVNYDIAKNRQGETGGNKLVFLAECTIFQDYTPNKE